jgi:molybdopterin converting factor small subunit
MNVQVGLPPALADLVGGRQRISVAIDGDQTTVGHVLDVVGGVHPLLVRRIRGEHGEFGHVEVGSDGVDVRAMAVEDTPLRDGAVLHVLPSVTGG